MPISLWLPVDTKPFKPSNLRPYITSVLCVSKGSVVAWLGDVVKLGAFRDVELYDSDYS